MRLSSARSLENCSDICTVQDRGYESAVAIDVLAVKTYRIALHILHGLQAIPVVRIVTEAL